MQSEPWTKRGRDRSSTLAPVIGITGSVGAGKSQVASFFARWGAVVVSGDLVGRYVVDNHRRLQAQLARAFGADILSRGRINRRLLAARAFADKAANDRLNALVHPSLLRELNRRVRTARRAPAVKAVVVDAALLAEWGPRKVPWNRLVGVWAPADLRRARLRRRGWSDSEIRRRARGQFPWTRKRAVCDYVVKNDASLAVLRSRARLCWGKIVTWGV